MIYEFDDFELDAAKVELRADGAPIAVEPQVFALLALLVESRDRVVSKDEIFEKVWDGRFVSDSALASRIKSARRALGDDGKAQKFIRTVQGRGFRFVADAKAKGAPSSVRLVDATPSNDPPSDGSAHGSVLGAEGSKPSVAVLPFRLLGVAGPYAGVADALPQELISALSRLRWLFVIARGSSFRFRSSDPDIVEVGRALSVAYCLSGLIEIIGDRMTVTVELSDTRGGGVLWGERYAGVVGDIHDIRVQIIDSVITALEIQIPLNEAQRARVSAPGSLSAWSTYHLGLQHLYRFNVKDNADAVNLFQRAIDLDAGFARAHAGLSSAHFQNAFMKYRDDPAAETTLARRHAEKSLELDPLDPFANLVMGRVHWVENDVANGIGWLDRAVSLNANYAQGHYARGWAGFVSGRVDAVDSDIDRALALSPLDPFRYAMLGVRAMSYLARGERSEAARWADEAARAPGAHVLIAMIAAALHEANENHEQALFWAENIRTRHPGLTGKDFFDAFPFASGPVRVRVAKALSVLGF